MPLKVNLMKSILKSLFGLALLLLISSGMKAQNVNPVKGYEIVPASGTNVALLRQALDGAKLDTYRMPSQRVTLNFADGTKVKLFSVSEMQTNGNPVNGSIANQSGTPNSNVWKLTPNGTLLEEASTKVK